MAPPVTISFLGGLGQIGRNCMTIEVDGRIVILDCGQMFTDESVPGVDAVLPDFSYLHANADRIEGCILTHAHEDHIGGVPYALRDLSFPIFGTRFTLAMLRHKLGEEGVAKNTDLIPISDGERLPIGPFSCEFLPVTHSTPMGLISAITTPQGVILHSSDFKLDLTPVDGRRTALNRIGAISVDPGIRLMMADSTNADSAGRSASESEIGPVLDELFRANAGRRMIVAAFSSHIHRVQQIADAAIAHGRTVVTLGLSMGRNITLAREHGLLRIPDDRIRDIADLDDLDPADTCVICTGSQGETRAALTLMATGDSRWLTVGSSDTVVFSSHPIPGNEAAIGRLQNDLARAGAEIVHSGHLGIHTSGHGKQHELQTLHAVASPEYFVPVHGEYTHLVAHHDLALGMGMDGDHVLLREDGQQVILDDDGIHPGGDVGGRHVYVDGILGALDDDVLDERRILGGDGFVAVHLTVDRDAGRIIAGPVVTTRGWLAPERERATAGEIAEAVESAARGLLADEAELGEVERVVRRTTGKMVSDRTRRRPMIVPVVTEV